jgi:hypothetical protein
MPVEQSEVGDMQHASSVTPDPGLERQNAAPAGTVEVASSDRQP